MDSAAYAAPVPRARGLALRHDLAGLLTRHIAGIAVAVALTAVIAAPRWWVITTEPSEGTRVPISVWGVGTMGTDEAQQTPTIRQAYDGKLPVRAPYLVTHADGPLQAGAGWQEFIGIFGHVTGGPFSSLAVVTSLMALWGMLALYTLAYGATGSRLAAACLVPIAMAAVQAFNYAGNFTIFRHWSVLQTLLTADAREFLAWTRFLSPVMVLGTFFTAVVVIPRAVETGGRGWIAGAAALVALLVYSYIFYWTAMALALAGWAAWLAWRREWPEFRRLLAIGVLAVVLAAPEFAIVASRSLTSTADQQSRVGQDPFAIGGLSDFAQRLIVALPFIAVLWRGPSRNGLLIALALSPMLLASVSGIVPQQWHYATQVWGVFALPLFIAGGTELVRRLPERAGPALRVTLLALAAAGATFVVAYQARAIEKTDASYAVSDDEGAAIAWIRDNVHGDQTVVSSSFNTIFLLESLTPASGYVGDGYNPVASDDEIIDRYLRAQVAYGYGEADTFDRLDPDYGALLDDVEPRAPENLEHRIEQQGAFFMFYAEAYNKELMLGRFPAWRLRFEALQRESDVLGAYPADYLYCGRRERSWPLEQPPSGIYVRVAFQQGDVTVYKLTVASDPQAREFAGCGAGAPP